MTLDRNSRPDARDLEELPVLCQGLADDLHYEQDGVRFWLSRTGLADGEPFDNTVTIEVLWSDRRWHEYVVYDGDDPETEVER